MTKPVVKKRIVARLGCLLLLVLSCGQPALAAIADEKRFCVFDIVGASGDIYNNFKNYVLEAMKVGQRLKQIAYADEHQAIADFKKGDCDLLAITDLSIREFNGFSGSISAIGAMPNYEDLRILLHTLASPRVASKLENDRYQILGVMPMGAAYLFVNDRSIDTVEDLKNKRMAVLDNHEDAKQVIRFVNAIPVPTSISEFADLFNRGMVDIAYAPAAAYEVLEMYKGMGAKGGIVNYPLGQLTTQLVTRKGTFPDAFVKKSRKIMAELFEVSMDITRRYEFSIPKDRWIELPPESIVAYQEMLRGARMQIRDQKPLAGQPVVDVYNPDMMTILRKVRCYTNRVAAECRSKDRE